MKNLQLNINVDIHPDEEEQFVSLIDAIASKYCVGTYSIIGNISSDNKQDQDQLELPFMVEDEESENLSKAVEDE